MLICFKRKHVVAMNNNGTTIGNPQLIGKLQSLNLRGKVSRALCLAAKIQHAIMAGFPAAFQWETKEGKYFNSFYWLSALKRTKRLTFFENAKKNSLVVCAMFGIMSKIIVKRKVQ